MNFLPVLAPIIFAVTFLTIALFVTLYQKKRERERTAAMRAVANFLKWNFVDLAPWNMIPNLDSFALFNHGHSKQIKNFMYGEANGVKAALFDYIYVVGSGRNRTTHFQSVVYLEPGNLRAPSFSLRPEGFFTKIMTAFGYQDIDFGQRPEFSKRYLLRGQDEMAIRQAFNDQLLAFFETYQGTSADAGNNQLFVFRADFRCSAEEVQNQLSVALSILNLLPRF